jgi:N-acyl-D-amino-acid deacylase
MTMHRRTFVRTTAVAAAGTLARPSLAFAPVSVRGRRADLVLRGATVFDGTGAPGREVDVAVTGDRIAAVGQRLPAGSEEIDLRGLALAPGFIDIHSHADLPLLVNPKAESVIRQGVTLVVVGQDGSSVGPWSDEEFEGTRDGYRSRYGVTIDFRDPPGFLARIDRDHPAVNLATMVGNGSVRALVVGGADRRATADELQRMKGEVRRAMNGGCVGLSSGLEYTPSGFADTAELIELATVLKGSGYPYASHMRNEDDRLLAAVEECLFIGQMAGVPVEVSHLKAQGRRNYWKADAVLHAIDQARAAGVDADFDRYPYTAYATGLSNLFPASAREGGGAEFVARLRAPDTGPALKQACLDKVALLGDWNSVQISSANDETAWARGKRMGDLARERGLDPYELTVQLLEANHGSMGMIGHGMSEENTAKVLAHPVGMVCSDGGVYAPYGPLSVGSPHPRGYGTFPRVLGHYVRDTKVLTLESAVHKMSGMAAHKLRLADRGRVATGVFADLVAFDPSTVADRATFDQPHQYPVGIPLVVVNGVPTIRDGEQTGRLAGRAVRGDARL